MKLWKVDSRLWTVREVEGEPWPGKDAEGDACYDNTHFRDPDAAWERLAAEVDAYARMVADDLVQARTTLRKREQAAADALVALQQVRAQREARAAAPG